MTDRSSEIGFWFGHDPPSPNLPPTLPSFLNRLRYPHMEQMVSSRALLRWVPATSLLGWHLVYRLSPPRFCFN